MKLTTTTMVSVDGVMKDVPMISKPASTMNLILRAAESVASAS